MTYWTSFTCAVLLCSSVVSGVQFGHQLRGNRSRGFTGVKRIKAYFINKDVNTARAQCMTEQLESIASMVENNGGVLEFERFHDVSFETCTDIESCIQEKPECFPTGESMYMFHSHHERAPDHRDSSSPSKPRGKKVKHIDPALDDSQGDMAISSEMVPHHGHARSDQTHNSELELRGVLDEWCAHLHLVNHMLTEDYDYYLIFIDDLIFTEAFPTSLMNFLHSYPDKWTLVEMDTFSNAKGGVPKQDKIDNMKTGKLYSMSPSKDTFWGGHAWLLNARQLKEFAQLINSGPAFVTDYVSKLWRPPSMGMWAYQTGTIQASEKTSFAHIDPEESRCSAAVSSKPNKDQNGLPTHITHVEFLPSTDVETAPTDVVVMGMPHAGVPLTAGLIKKHFGIDAKWTEAHPTQYGTISMPKGQNTVAVFVVRHPFAIMQRYHFHSQSATTNAGMQCGGGNEKGMAWVNAGCVFGEPNTGSDPNALAVPKKSTCHRKRRGAKTTCWPTIMKTWNEYMTGYEKLRKSGKFKKVVLLRYEDLYKDTATQFKHLKISTGLQPNPSTIQEESPLPEQTGLDLTPELESLDFGVQWGCDVMKEICRRLDRRTLWTHGYVGCQTEWTGYKALIYDSTDASVETGKDDDQMKGTYDVQQQCNSETSTGYGTRPQQVELKK